MSVLAGFTAQRAQPRISLRYQTKTEQLWLSSQADLNELLASGRAVVEVTVSPVEELPRDKSRHPRLLGTPLATICSLDGTESNSGPDPVTPVLSVPPTPAVGAPASDSPPIKCVWSCLSTFFLFCVFRFGYIMQISVISVCRYGHSSVMLFLPFLRISLCVMRYFP